jgi:hypothetical protein
VNELALGLDPLDLGAEEESSPPVDGADGERGCLSRGSQPGFLDPADQPLLGLESKAVAAEQIVS